MVRADKGISGFEAIQKIIEAYHAVAYKLLEKHPDVDIDDRKTITDLCLKFEVDLRPNSGGQFSYEDIRRALRWYRYLAQVEREVRLAPK
jgi:hypothetical protein